MKKKRTRRRTNKVRTQKRKKKTKNDNVVYIKNFLNQNDFNKIKGLNTDKNNFKHEKFRYIRPLDRNIDGDVYNIFYDNKYIKKIQRHLNPKIFESEFPIEHRIYDKDSEGMKWHKDTLLYKKPQYEAIFTIDNMSKSETHYKDENDRLHKLWTEPNTLLVVKAQGYSHGVTPTLTGEREILKLIYTQTNEINDNYIQEMKRFDKLN
tara:strand:- start:2171 stop:2791 length:621 start_codon:yes stop_codon:yes gene_type:complete